VNFHFASQESILIYEPTAFYQSVVCVYDCIGPTDQPTLSLSWLFFSS